MKKKNKLVNCCKSKKTDNKCRRKKIIKYLNYLVNFQKKIVYLKK